MVLKLKMWEGFLKLRSKGTDMVVGCKRVVCLVGIGRMRVV